MIRRRRASLASEKLIHQQKRRRRVFLFVFLGSLLVLVGLFYAVFRISFFKIDEIRVSGNEVVDGNRITEITNDMLDENYFLLFPKRNWLLYPRDEIKSRIKKEIGRIEDITLDVKDNILNIKIGERGAYALWCREETRCFFIDSSGLIFSEAPLFSSGVYKTFTGIISDDEPLGRQFLDRDKLQGVETMASFLETKGWNTEKVEVLTLRDVVLVQNKGPKIRIDLTKSVADSVNVLKTLLSSNEFKKSASNILSIDYIDVRFGSKVFFKSKNSGTVPAAAFSAPL